MSLFKKLKTALKTKLGLVVVGSTALVGVSAHADDASAMPTFDFITPIKASFTGIASDLGGFFLIVLGISVIVAIYGIMRGGVKKSSSS